MGARGGAAPGGGVSGEGAPAVRRVLVVRRRALGDLVLSLPALDLLRRGLPGAEIDLLMDGPLVETARAWAGADRVVAFPDRATGPGWARRAAALRRLVGELAGRRYDLAVDLHSTPQTALLCRLTGAPRRVGLDLPGRRWAYTVRVARTGGEPGPTGRPRYIASALADVAAAALGRRGAGADLEPRFAAPPAETPAAGGPRRPRVALAPGATWAAKAWPAESYREVALALSAERGASVTVFWGPGEEPLARAVAAALPGVTVAPPGDVRELAERLRGHDLLISGDSGARHIAIAAGVRTLALFGPTDPWTATPPGGRHRWLRYPIACAPCQRTRCELAANHCLGRVTPAEVLRVAAEMLA